MALIDALLEDLRTDAQATRQVIEQITDPQLAWRPSVAARTLGQVALQTVNQPRAVAQLVSTSAPVEAAPAPACAADLLPLLEQSLTAAQQQLVDLDDAALLAAWRLMQGDHELMALPRGALLRSLLLEQWSRQRAQLALYLRTLGVTVPVNGGVDAEPNPFVVPEIIRGLR